MPRSATRSKGEPIFEGRRAGEVSRRLLEWFRREGRDLPWRHRPNPYRVWISEIMLQQTTVPVVERYYGRFLRRLPGVAALARAREEDVLALWSGLGYYRRARNLIPAARAIVERHAGRIPSDIDDLRALPGIGEYTAGAIRSIGFNLPAVAMDANIVRVLARLGAIRGDTTAARTRSRIADLAAALMPAEHPSAFNQGLMDLGAMVCTPRAPRCDICPLAGHCAARAAGLVERIPQVRKDAAAIHVAMEALAIMRGESGRGAQECLLVQREGKSLNGKLWEFPMVAEGVARRLGNEGAFAESARRRTKAVRGIEELAGRLGARMEGQVGEIPHSITRHRIRIRIFKGMLAGGRSPSKRGVPAMRWVSLADLASGRDGIASTGSARKIARHLSRASDRAARRVHAGL